MLRRSAMKRSTKPLKSIGVRGKRMRQGKVEQTAEESLWLLQIQSLGCIVCLLQYGANTPSEIHHMKQGDRRMGHLFSLALCYPHHRGGEAIGLFISRHPHKTRFVDAYGTEEYLLEQTKHILETGSPSNG